MLIAIDGTNSWDRGEPGPDDTNTGKLFRAYRGTKLYLPGLGTQRPRIIRWTGTLFGLGGRDRVREALTFVDSMPREPIDLVGWSRGAALCLHVSNRLADMGHSVRYIGLMDTVAQFGLPWGWNWGLRLTLDPRVSGGNAAHAVMGPRRRWIFPLTRVEGAREMAFTGTHRDAGTREDVLRWIRAAGAAVGVPW